MSAFEHAVSPTPSSSLRGRALRPHQELLTGWTLLLLGAGEMHGYKLHRELRARGIDLQATSLYRWLRTFERDGWVTARWSEPTLGPRRHVYVLSPEGRSMLRTTTALIATTREAYSTFLAAYAHAVARRGEDAVVDEAATPAPDDDTTAPANGPSSAGSSQSALRPHKELLVGWLLLQLDAGATYGWRLRRELEARRLSPDPAALYRTLRRLEADKWVQSRWMQPAAGPPRRFYRLTTRGRRNLDETARLIEAIRDSHEAYLQAYAHADRVGDAAIGGDDNDGDDGHDDLG